MTNPSGSSNNIPFAPIPPSTDSNKQSSQNATGVPHQNNLDNFLIKSKSSLSLSSTIDKEWFTLKFQNLEEKVASVQQKQNEMQEELSSVMINLMKKMDSIESVLEKHQFMIEEQYSMLSDKNVKKASFESSQSITKCVQDCEHKIDEIKLHLDTLERKQVYEPELIEKLEIRPHVKIPKIEKPSKTKSTSQKFLQNILDDKASQLVKPRKQEPIMLDDSWFCDEL
ncbi:predicted protein [Naegleria gruberi]|uniref:Predicted protein n=1 Tax=Naegleria gruberi TaxID=5762 RepID=D2W429_NAEGR|nr:uncharacterized protein NAEGRDRAFT_54539 [Naegleria gruberi]EFC36190.1 predicted protein [Naegleria gruberi]|eukprot:XP_002668934.1 predicted protein [Naegleria gruberi strain NEG-M]